MVIETATSDVFEVTEFSLQGMDEVREGLTHTFRGDNPDSRVLVVLSDVPDLIREVVFNGQNAERVVLDRSVAFLAHVDAGEVQVRISLDEANAPTERSATVWSGLFTKSRDRVRGMLRRALLNSFDPTCRACKILVRMAIELLTGGAGLVGDAVDEAFAALRGLFESYLEDTILGEILKILNGFVNPAALFASEICRRLGYCQ